MSKLTKKSERISSAIYLVTSFFDDKEPLKWRLRSLATDLASMGVKDKSVTASDVLALFMIAKNAGLVSDANHDILARELSIFINEVRKSLITMLSDEIVS